MSTSSRRLSKNRQRGSGYIEFALVYLAFLLLVLGLLDFGRAVWAYTTVNHAAREGARFAMTRGGVNPATAAEVEAIVKSNAIGLDQNLIVINTVWDPNNEWSPDIQRGSIVRVQVQYPLQLITAPLVLQSAVINLGSTAQFVIAN